MSAHRLRRSWTDPGVELSAERPRLPVELTFRHLETSPSVATRIDAEAQKLLRYFAPITRCHVVIAAPHRHHRHGRSYTVHLELDVPGERIVIDHEPAAHPRTLPSGVTKRAEPQASHHDIYVVIREAFDSARRRLEDYARRVRGDVKRHEAPPPAES